MDESRANAPGLKANSVAAAPPSSANGVRSSPSASSFALTAVEGEGRPSGLRPLRLLSPLPASLRRRPAPPREPWPAAAALSSSCSAPSLRPLPPLPARESIYSRNWTTESRRYLHQRRERHWLARKAKHCYIDFSDSEREELRCYFLALAEGGSKLRLAQLEDMLISLGVADDKRDVAAIVEKVHPDCGGALDFEQYLELVQTKAGSGILGVLKDMMAGQLGDRALNFQTIISQCRRGLIFDSTGAGSPRGEQQERGGRVLRNYVALVRGRRAEAAAAEAAEKARVDGARAEEESVEDQELRNFEAEIGRWSGSQPPGDVVPFESDGQAPLGGLELVWRGVCHEHRLVSSRPTSADRRRAFERPPSPSEVVASIVKVKLSRTKHSSNRTVIVRAPAYNSSMPE